VRESNRGEPAEFELQEILKEKQRRYNEYYERWSRGEAARRVEWNRREREEYSNNREDYKEREFNLKEYVPVISRGVDLRSIRPITREKIRGMRDEEIFYYEGNTKTVERVVLGIMSRMMKPREREDFGITKGSSIRFSKVERFPNLQEAREGKGLYNHVISTIRNDIRRYIVLEPYGELSSATI
jgi:hypothetical protein